MSEEQEPFFKETDEGGEEEPVEIELAKAGGSIASRPRMSIGKSEEPEDFDSEPEGQLTIDVYQTPSEIVIESAVAGVAPEDLEIHITSDSISIKGKRSRSKKVEDRDYFYQECYWGRFSRSVILPQEIDPEGSFADFKNGILTVHLPKLDRKKTKRLKVRMD